MSALVQQARNSTASGTSVAVTISAPAAGSALVAFVAMNGAASDVLSISGGGVTWAIAEHGASANYYNPIWYGLNSSGSGTTVTVTSNATGRIAVIVAEFSGILTSGALDTTNSNWSTVDDTAASAGSVTPSAQPNVVIASVAHTLGAISVGPSGFTQLTQSSAGVNPVSDGAYIIQTSTTAQNASWTLGATSDWDATAITLLGTTGAVTSTDPAVIGGGFI